MDIMDWLEPSIENGVARVFAENEKKNVQMNMELFEIIKFIRNDAPENLEASLLKLENRILSCLYSAVNYSYRAGFKDAAKFLK